MNRQTDKEKLAQTFALANIYAESVTVRCVRLGSVQKKLVWIHFHFVKTLL